MNGAIVVLTKGKGKGKGAAKGDSRAMKGFHSKSAGKGGEAFDGYCHHCGGYGHRKAQCKHLDLEMAAKGKGKGKGKGRDKGKGKGLYYSGPWEEPGEEDETCQEESPENDKAEIADDSWWLEIGRAHV